MHVINQLKYATKNAGLLFSRKKKNLFAFTLKKKISSLSVGKKIKSSARGQIPGLPQKIKWSVPYIGIYRS